MGALQSPYKEEDWLSPYIQRALLWGLHKAPIEMALCKAPRDFVHIYIHTHAHFSLFPTDMGMLHYGGFAKGLYRRGFLLGICKAHIESGFIMGDLQSPYGAEALQST